MKQKNWQGKKSRNTPTASRYIRMHPKEMMAELDSPTTFAADSAPVQADRHDNSVHGGSHCNIACPRILERERYEPEFSDLHRQSRSRHCYKIQYNENIRTSHQRHQKIRHSVTTKTQKSCQCRMDPRPRGHPRQRASQCRRHRSNTGRSNQTINVS